MRLIVNDTLKLKEFQGDANVPYAILSHTWGHDEVTYQDMQLLAEESKEVRAKRLGKIAKTAEIAAKDGILYSWVDTCCIDKTSSAELSEAINSMFRWYKLSKICFVYLSDFTYSENFHLLFKYSKSRSMDSHEDEDDQPMPSIEYDYKKHLKYFGENMLRKKCRWFSRGWTLQELIAHTNTRFFDANWNQMLGLTMENWDSAESMLIAYASGISLKAWTHRSGAFYGGRKNVLGRPQANDQG